jgi:hypothetical protein
VGWRTDNDGADADVMCVTACASFALSGRPYVFALSV